MTTAKDQIKHSKQPKPPEPPRWETKGDDALYQAYHQRIPTGMWFAPGNMRAFATVILDVWYNPSTTDYLFITRETRRSMHFRNTSGHTLRWMDTAGKIVNVTELMVSLTTCTRALNNIIRGTQPLEKHP